MSDDPYRTPMSSAPVKSAPEGSWSIGSHLRAFIRFYIYGGTITFGWMILNGWFRLGALHDAIFNGLFVLMMAVCFLWAGIHAFRGRREAVWPLVACAAPILYVVLYGCHHILSMCRKFFG